MDLYSHIPSVRLEFQGKSIDHIHNSSYNMIHIIVKIYHIIYIFDINLNMYLIFYTINVYSILYNQTRYPEIPVKKMK